MWEYSCAAHLVVAGVDVHAQRLLPPADEGHGLVHSLHAEDGEDRAGGILLHDGVRLHHVGQDGRRFGGNKQR